MYREGHVPIWSAVNQPFVERSKPTTSLAEQDSSDVTHIHGRANKDDITIDGAVFMALESPGVEQKPHDGDNEAMVLVNSRASGNYFEDQLISQPSKLAFEAFPTARTSVTVIELHGRHLRRQLRFKREDFLRCARPHYCSRLQHRHTRGSR